MADQLAEFDEIVGVKCCKVARLLAGLPAEDQAAFAAAAQSGRFQNGTFIEWLARRDLKTGKDSVRLHVTGACCCE